jgi:Mlc titration factor MtfA (ptsG expression regulator)
LTVYLALLAVALVILGVVLGGPLLRERRRRRLRAQSLPSAWDSILEHYVPASRRMPGHLRQRWHEAIQQFLGEKRFVGCDGLGVTEEMRVAIAGQACMMVVNREHRAFDDVRFILVYPTAFHVTRHEVDEAGVETVERTLLSGESWDSGRVIVSWDDVWHAAREGRDGENVVLHEFAHQLGDAESADGTPLVSDDADWEAVLAEEYESLLDKAERGDASVLDHYGASDRAEFFAVATEAFFGSPQAMREEHPQLYARLCGYYRLDPASWEESAQRAESRG